jgi:hypothetical protein
LSSLDIGGTLRAIGAALDLYGGDGNDQLLLDASGDSADLSGSLSEQRIEGLGSAAGGSYSGFEAAELRLGSGADRLTIAGSLAGSTVVRTGAGADQVTVTGTLGAVAIDSGADDDSIAVQGISGALTVNAGDGDDTINVVVHAVPDDTRSSIKGPLTINGDDGIDTLNVDDSGNTGPATLTIDGNSISGLGLASGITFTSIENHGFTLGGGGNTVNIRSLSNALHLHTGSGDDTINVGSLAPATVNGIGARLTIDGDAGNDTLNVDDSGDPTANSGVLTAGKLSGLGMAVGIDYANIETLHISLGSGGNHFAITGTPAAAAQTLINTGAGDDTVTVALTSPNDGPLTVNLQAGKDSLDASASSLGVVVFGGDGADSIIGGMAADVLSGDGRQRHAVRRPRQRLAGGRPGRRPAAWWQRTGDAFAPSGRHATHRRAVARSGDDQRFVGAWRQRRCRRQPEHRRRPARCRLHFAGRRLQRRRLEAPERRRQLGQPRAPAAVDR